MKTQFKHHIKFGSCWFDNFFNVNTKSTFAKAPVGKDKNYPPADLLSEAEKQLKHRNHVNKK